MRCPDCKRRKMFCLAGIWFCDPCLAERITLREIAEEASADLAGLDLSPEALYEPRPGDALALRGDDATEHKDPLTRQRVASALTGSPTHN